MHSMAQDEATMMGYSEILDSHAFQGRYMTCYVVSYSAQEDFIKKWKGASETILAHQKFYYSALNVDALRPVVWDQFRHTMKQYQQYKGSYRSMLKALWALSTEVPESNIKLHSVIKAEADLYGAMLGPQALNDLRGRWMRACDPTSELAAAIGGEEEGLHGSTAIVDAADEAAAPVLPAKPYRRLSIDKIIAFCHETATQNTAVANYLATQEAAPTLDPAHAMKLLKDAGDAYAVGDHEAALAAYTRLLQGYGHRDDQLPWILERLYICMHHCGLVGDVAVTDAAADSVASSAAAKASASALATVKPPPPKGPKPGEGMPKAAATSAATTESTEAAPSTAVAFAQTLPVAKSRFEELRADYLDAAKGADTTALP